MLLTSTVLTWLCYYVGLQGYSFLWVVLALGIIAGMDYRFAAKSWRQIEEEEKKLAKGYNPDHLTEQAEWLNGVLLRAWQFLAPQLERNISKSVEGILNYSKPGIVKSFSFKEFNLGRAGPTVSHLLANSQTEMRVVRQDMKITFKQPDAHIRLAVKLNNLLGGLPKPVISVAVKDISFSGILTIDAKLQDTFPYSEILKIGFKERPDVSMEIKPLGVEITALPWLAEWIYNAIEDALQTNMVDQSLELNLDAMLNPKRELNAEGLSEGILLIDIVEGVNLPRVGHNNNDLYVRLSVDQQVKSTPPTARSSSTVFDTTCRFLVHRTATVAVTAEVFDKSNYGADACILKWKWDRDTINRVIESNRKEPITWAFEGPVEPGHISLQAQFYTAPPLPIPIQLELGFIDDDEAREEKESQPANENSEVEHDFEPVGEAEIASKAEKNEKAVPLAVDDDIMEREMWQTGLLVIHIIAAKKLRSPSRAQYLQPYVTVHQLNHDSCGVYGKHPGESKDDSEAEKDRSLGTKVYRTQQTAGTDVQFDEFCEVLITCRDQDRVSLCCKNKLVTSIERLGVVVINVGTHLRVTNWQPPQWMKFSDNPGNGRIKISLCYINMDLGSSLGYCAATLVDPKAQKAQQELLRKLNVSGKLGTLTLTVHEARRLKAADRGGCSDPFVTAQIKKVKIAQTKVVRESLAPVWDETFTVQLPDTHGINILFQVYDWDKMSSPDLIGQVWIDLDTMAEDEFGLPYLSGWLPLDNVKTGLLKVSMFFIPPGYDSQRRVLKKTTSPTLIQSAAPAAGMNQSPLIGPSPKTNKNYTVAVPASPSPPPTFSFTPSLSPPNSLQMKPNRRGSSESAKSHGSPGKRPSLPTRLYILFINIKQCTGLPRSAFHPLVKIKVNDKTVSTSAHFQPKETVVFDFVSNVTLPLDLATATLSITLADWQGFSLTRTPKTEYSTATPLSLSTYLRRQSTTEKDGTDTYCLSVSLVPNEKAASLHGTKQPQLEFSLSVTEKH